MKNFWIWIGLTAICSGILCTPTVAQDLGDLFTRYSADEADGYSQPLCDALGADLNSGWFRTAAINKNKFQLFVGIVVQTAIIPEKQKSFTATTPDYFTPTRTVEAPTIFGNIEGVRVQGINGTAYTFAGGANMNILPFAVPQVSIGGIHGTEASFRFVAIGLDEDVGDLKIFGWGLRHSVSQYFKNLPVHIAVGYFQNRFKLSDVSDSRATLFNLIGSYQSGILELYGGPGYESSSLEFSYEREDGEEIDEVDVSLEGKNNFRFTLGALLHLGALKFNIDYNIANQSTVSAALGLGFGYKNVRK